MSANNKYVQHISQMYATNKQVKTQQVNRSKQIVNTLEQDIYILQEKYRKRYLPYLNQKKQTPYTSILNKCRDQAYISFVAWHSSVLKLNRLQYSQLTIFSNPHLQQSASDNKTKREKKGLAVPILQKTYRNKREEKKQSQHEQGKYANKLKHPCQSQQLQQQPVHEDDLFFQQQ